MVIVFDRLRASRPSRPSRFTVHLHSAFPMVVDGRVAEIGGERSACRVTMAASADLELSYTDRFDPPPRARIQLTRYHLDATTARVPSAELVTVIQVRRRSAEAVRAPVIRRDEGGFFVTVPWREGRAAVRLRSTGCDVELQAGADQSVVRRELR